MTQTPSDRKPPAIGVSPAQIVAGALASVTAAVVASYFGIGGTLIGAAITSVVATLGGALYRLSLESAGARVVRVTRNPRTGEMTREVAQEPAPARPARRVRWGPVAGAFVLIFGLAIGAVTALEVAAKEPLAAVLGRQDAPPGKTSIGSVVQSVGETNPAPTATPAETPAGVPSAAPGIAVPTSEGTAMPASAAPSAAPSVAPSTAPGQTPATTPTTRTAPTTVPALAPTVQAPPSGAPSTAPTQAPVVVPTQASVAPAQTTEAPAQP